ncbi:MAG: hypothetical protein IJR58_01245, partial [Lachnospiraceae bacterium]|nr:hypothetical protein [Lachnospiraceae bacterium]
QWAVVDVTTNDQDICANAVLFVPDEVMRGFFAEETSYLLDSELYRMHAESYDDEFYRYSGQYVPVSEVKDYLAAKLSGGQDFTFRTDCNVEEDYMITMFSEALAASGVNPYNLEGVGMFLGVMQVRVK